MARKRHKPSKNLERKNERLAKAVSELMLNRLSLKEPLDGKYLALLAALIASSMCIQRSSSPSFMLALSSVLALLRDRKRSTDPLDRLAPAQPNPNLAMEGDDLVHYIPLACHILFSSSKFENRGVRSVNLVPVQGMRPRLANCLILCFVGRA